MILLCASEDTDILTATYFKWIDFGNNLSALFTGFMYYRVTRAVPVSSEIQPYQKLHG